MPALTCAVNSGGSALYPAAGQGRFQGLARATAGTDSEAGCGQAVKKCTFLLLVTQITKNMRPVAGCSLFRSFLAFLPFFFFLPSFPCLHLLVKQTTTLPSSSWHTFPFVKRDIFKCIFRTPLPCRRPSSGTRCGLPATLKPSVKPTPRSE